MSAYGGGAVHRLCNDGPTCIDPKHLVISGSSESPWLNRQRNACDRCGQGVMDADSYDARGRLTGLGNPHLYGRCECPCHA